MGDLIIVKDKFAISRSNVLYLEWVEGFDSGQKVKGLIIYFNKLSSSTAENYTLIGDDALEFWNKYTGQTVSWDERLEYISFSNNFWEQAHALSIEIENFENFKAFYPNDIRVSNYYDGMVKRHEGLVERAKQLDAIGNPPH